jgi:hypothetical protein
MEAIKERKWALKYMYPNGDHQYAGEQCLNDYVGAGRDLAKALLFNSQQEALQDMMRRYHNVAIYRGSTYPVPVPVIVETKTTTVIYEEGSNV